MRPLNLSKWDKSLQHIIDDMHGRPLNIHALLAHHPALLDAWWKLRMHLVRGGELEQRDRELVILRVARHNNSWYEWASHVVRGLDSGLSMNAIERLQKNDGGWDEKDAALLAAVDQLVHRQMLEGESLDELCVYFSNRQILDIMHLYGMYTTLACMIGTWGLALDEQVAERLPAAIDESSFGG
jgi:alkylhydroperoxidase family enzyme